MQQTLHVEIRKSMAIYNVGTEVRRLIRLPLKSNVWRAGGDQPMAEHEAARGAPVRLNEVQNNLPRPPRQGYSSRQEPEPSRRNLQRRQFGTNGRHSRYQVYDTEDELSDTGSTPVMLDRPLELASVNTSETRPQNFSRRRRSVHQIKHETATITIRHKMPFCEAIMNTPK